MMQNVFRHMVQGYRIVHRQTVEPIPVVIQGFQVPMPVAVPQMQEERLEDKKKIPEAKPLDYLQIPKFSEQKIKAKTYIPTEGEKRIVAPISYPLIPRRPQRGETVFALAKISWDQKSGRYLYQLVEPVMSEGLQEIMKKVKDLLEQKLDVDFSKLKRFEAADYLHKNVDEIIDYFGLKVSDEERKILHYYIQRDFIGLGRIEAFMNDSELEDISCDGVGIPIFVFHRNSAIGSVMTNVVFNDGDELDSFIIRLSQLSGKSISVTTPLAEGSLPDGSRLQATLATDIARRGSNFTIRKFTEEPLTPTHLLNYNTLDVQTMAYLWLAIDYGKSILVSGGTATGKTSLLNVLSLFIEADKKIISIEDTPELKLPHPHWIPTVARSAITVEGKTGEVDMFDLLKGSMRQRPDFIIMGEVRGREAFVLFQEMATGHPSLATIHAENVPKLIDRLTTQPISLPPSLVGSLDVIVFMSMLKYKDRHVRRVNEILEVTGVDEQTKMPVINQVFKWNATTDKFDIKNDSYMLKKIAENAGKSETEIKEELEKRMLVLDWLLDKNIANYKDIFRIVTAYHANHERLIALIKGGA